MLELRLIPSLRPSLFLKAAVGLVRSGGDGGGDADGWWKFDGGGGSAELDLQPGKTSQSTSRVPSHAQRRASRASC